MWPLVLLPCGDGVRPLLPPSAAALPSLSVTERSSSGLASSSVAGMERGHCCFPRRPRSFPLCPKRQSSSLAGIERGHCCFPQQPRTLHPLLLSEAAEALHPPPSRGRSATTAAFFGSSAPSPVHRRAKRQWPHVLLFRADRVWPLLPPSAAVIPPTSARASSSPADFVFARQGLRR